MTPPVGERGEVFAFFDGAWRSGVQFFLYESEEFQNDGIFELGARSGYIHRMDDMELEFAGFGRNILGETAFTGGIDFNNLTGFVNEPQFFGAEAIARF